MGEFLLWIWILGAVIGWVMSLNWHLKKNAEGIKNGLPDYAFGLFIGHIFWFSFLCLIGWPWVIKDVINDKQSTDY